MNLRKSTLNTPKAFTLAELLIALAILGVIATFTIPKILDSGSSSKHNAVLKEAASIISGAYQSYKKDNAPSGSTSGGDLMPYLNYVNEVTNIQIDGDNGSCVYLAIDCSSLSNVCYRLHNGSIIRYYTGGNFNDTQSTNAMWFLVDPDGKLSGASDENGKGIYFFLYFNGRLRTFNTIEPNTYDAAGTYNPSSCSDPSYFSWSN